MADVNLINLPKKTTPADTDIVIIEDAVATKRMTWANLVKPIKDMIGNLASLTTNHKTTLVGATNELKGKIDTLEANSSLQQLSLQFNNGYAVVESTVLNISNTSNYYWFFEVYTPVGNALILSGRRYTTSIAFYLYHPNGSAPPNGLYTLNILRINK